MIKHVGRTNVYDDPPAGADLFWSMLPAPCDGSLALITSLTAGDRSGRVPAPLCSEGGRADGADETLICLGALPFMFAPPDSLRSGHYE